MCSQSCPTLCDSMDCSPPGFSVHGTSQARRLEWIAISSSRRIFPPQGLSPCLLHLQHWQVDSLPLESPVCVLVTPLCLTLCDPMDCSPPGTSVHGILQARILEWVAIPSSRGSSGPRNQNPASADGLFTTRCYLGSLISIP